MKSWLENIRLNSDSDIDVSLRLMLHLHGQTFWMRWRFHGGAVLYISGIWYPISSALRAVDTQWSVGLLTRRLTSAIGGRVLTCREDNFATIFLFIDLLTLHAPKGPATAVCRLAAKVGNSVAFIIKHFSGCETTSTVSAAGEHGFLSFVEGVGASTTGHRLFHSTVDPDEWVRRCCFAETYQDLLDHLLHNVIFNRTKLWRAIDTSRIGSYERKSTSTYRTSDHVVP